jgi:DNA-binding XRE family transcriptional regulator
MAVGWSRERLAREARLSTRTIFAIEKEKVKPSSATQTVLAAALDLPRAELFPDA